MIEPKRQRELRQITHTKIVDVLTSITKDDEEFFFCSLWAQNYISNWLLDFTEETEL